MKIVDLSKTIQFNEQDPPFMQVKVESRSHAESLPLIESLGLERALMPKRFQGWADDTIMQLGTHSTTHLDAPWHYGPECEGRPAKTIDQIPLDWCYGEGLVIDMSHKADYEPIEAEDIQAFLLENKLELRSGQIVLIRTGRDKLMGTMAFFLQGTGMTAGATRYLIEHGIKVMGIDQWGWDLPLMYLMQKAKETDNAELFWEAHLVGLDAEYCHMEQLCNLDSLPLQGFKVAVFPLKIAGASAAPARVVAIFED